MTSARPGLTRVGYQTRGGHAFLTRMIDTAKIEYACGIAAWNSAAQQPALFLQSNY
jgi:hypothetical protein